MQSLAILFIWFVPHIIMASSVCPISPASVHAKCAMTVKFDQPCDVVRSEMEGRIQSTTWVDPHNQGTYTISDSSSEGRIEVSRLTGDKRFTDKMAIEFDSTVDKGGQGRCTVRACSTSQVTSILDFQYQIIAIFEISTAIPKQMDVLFSNTSLPIRKNTTTAGKGQWRNVSRVYRRRAIYKVFRDRCIEVLTPT
jgi:hypothetical protein